MQDGFTYADDNPYLDKPTNEDNQKALRRIDEGARRVATGEPLDSLEEDSLNNSVEQQDVAITETAEANRAEAFNGLIEELALQDRRDVLPKAISARAEDYSDSVERAKSALGPFYARVYETPGAENLTEQQLIDIAVDDYVLDSMAKAVDDQGGWEMAGDILNMALIPDESYNATQISEANLLTSLDGIRSVAERRSALSPDERIKFDQALYNSIGEFESSEIQRYTTMLDVMGNSPETAVAHYVDKFAVGEIALVGLKLMKGLRGLNKMRKLSKVGDNETAAVMSQMAARDKQMAEGLGVPQADAAMAGNPLKAGMEEDVLNGTTTTASTETRLYTQEEIEKNLEKVDSVFGANTDLSQEERLQIAKAYAEEMETKDNVVSATVEYAGPDFVEIRALDKNGDETTISKEFTIDDFGGFETKESGLGRTLTRGLWSPMFLNKGADRKLLADAPIFGEFQRARINEAYTQAVNAAVKPIKGNKKSVEKINYVMEKLNGRDVDNSYHAMVNVGVGGTKLTDKEYKSFAGIRRVFDHMHRMNNETIRRDYELRGLKSIENSDGSITYAKTYREPGDAIKGYNADPNNNQVAIFDDSGDIKTVGRVDKDELDMFYGEGKVLIKADSKDELGWFGDASENYSRYALVPRDRVKGIPEQVLPYTPNYAPRSRKDANYFIKKRHDIHVNGNKKESSRTVAWAHTKTQADAWKARAEKTDGGEFDVVFDREMRPTDGSSAQDDEIAIRMNGGLYRGSRSSREIVFAGDAEDGKMVDALDSIQDAIRYTSDRMAMGELRTVLKHRWYNDAKEVDPNIVNTPWTEAKGAIEGSNADIGVKSRLLANHSQISNISGIPTRSEQEFSGVLKAIAKGMDKTGKMDTPAKWMYNKATNTNPVNTLKGGSFHLMLGAYNPAQYAVQMMSAATAVSANPVAFTKAVPSIFAASVTDVAEDMSSVSKSVRLLAKKGLVPEDTAKDVEFWRSSGMRESVLRNNADFDNSTSFRPLDAGAVRRGVGNIANRSTVFYEAGELASMRTSFFTALKKIKAERGDKFTYSNTDMQDVVARAERYRLGMSSANKAAYQRGILALPTQFKSIYTKFIESMAGDWFTGTEKARILLGQMALYGAVGVPFVNHWADVVVEMLAGDDPSPEEISGIRNGAVGWLLNDFYDIDAALSGRVAIAGDLVGEVRDMMFAEEPFLKSFMGASFTSTDKSIDAFKNIAMAGKMVWEDEQADNLTKLSRSAKVVGYNLAQIPTSTRRWAEAYVLGAYGEVRTSSGRLLGKKMAEDVQTRDVVARSLGFSSEDLQEIYETNQAIYDRRDKVNNISDVYLNLIHSLTIGVDQGDEEEVEAVHMALSALKSRIDSDQDREDIEAAILKGLSSREFQERTFDQWLELHTSELLKAKGKLNPVFQREYEEIVE
ncbi:putative tail sheath [Salinivibrio phage CW02]|uniref:Putative tail sheath n=1 Tax=Salinivibrio phage CW02 TaxID=1161935 RepID=H9D1G4_9CAUD|nr:internal virion protein [Salinivibrio phage CW02]AFE86206.1 putative tail sheath [Salinivibrio phage CW02]